MSSALRRGRTLDPQAVKRAKKYQQWRLKYLLVVVPHRIMLTLKERSEARRLTGRWDFWEVKTK